MSLEVWETLFSSSGMSVAIELAYLVSFLQRALVQGCLKISILDCIFMRGISFRKSATGACSG